MHATVYATSVVGRIVQHLLAWKVNQVTRHVVQQHITAHARLVGNRNDVRLVEPKMPLQLLRAAPMPLTTRRPRLRHHTHATVLAKQLDCFLRTRNNRHHGPKCARVTELQRFRAHSFAMPLLNEPKDVDLTYVGQRVP